MFLKKFSWLFCFFSFELKKSFYIQKKNLLKQNKYSRMLNQTLFLIKKKLCFNEQIIWIKKKDKIQYTKFLLVLIETFI